MDIVKLYPECKDNIWGGNTLKEKYGKQTDKTPCAESWELSFHKDGETRLANGKTLKETVTDKDLGANALDFPFFPTLVKFIDAKDDLSVQVHPSDSYALAHENSFGKTEMWYIVEAEEGAGIYLGFNRTVTKEEYETAIKEKRLLELLNFYKVRAGECYFIPSGTIHAIGTGCLICEIQQNSNLTYRVYDYGRKDKNGNERELHIEKALKVTELSRFESKPLRVTVGDGERIGASRYFTVTKLCVAGEVAVYADEKSFRALTCVRGSGYIEEQEMRAGDTYFVPANYGKTVLKGNMEVVMTEIRKYYIGIDLGGTFIKGGIVDDLGNVLVSDKVPTEVDGGSEVIVGNIAKLCNLLLAQANMTFGDVEGIGMGVPGTIDGEAGVVVYANNLHWENFPIGKELEKRTGVKVKIANDANVAALGETKFGCGKNYKNTILITLGTGVGGGIVIDGKLFEGVRSAGAELGHSVIVAGGEPCTCGRKGCLEAYASATALIRDTKRAMEADKNSKMWEIGSIDKVTGKTAFDYYKTDASAKKVVDRYIELLGVGLTNLANEFRPEVLILGGGVCAQGDALVKPLQAFLDREIYGGKTGPQVKILTATLGNSAGLLGGAALLME